MIPKIINSDKKMMKELEEYLKKVCNENGAEFVVPKKNKTNKILAIKIEEGIK